MLVFGDIVAVESADLVVAEIADQLVQWQAMAPGLPRHQCLVATFIRASELVQGVTDKAFEGAGCDELGETQELGNRVLLAIARALVQSWDSSYHGAALELDARWLDGLAQTGAIKTKHAEGYSFYALYPESYIAAARQSGLGANTTVIGIRSIGAGLAALVAAAIGADNVFNVRPVGHPFARRLSLGEKLGARLRAGSGDFAIVDEGPGLSGSSFNSVADWLTEQGVAGERIHFFPSHGGQLGPQASAAHRQRWAAAKRHHVSFEQLVFQDARPERRLEQWIASTVGALDQPLQDLSGGAWRTHRFGQSASWPPSDAAMERRKFMAVAGGRRWLAKFVGIGGGGDAKLVLAKSLGERGFAPAPAGLCHGFLLLPWIEVDETGAAGPPVGRVLDYLTFRAGLPAQNPGASLAELFTMASYNVGQVWGEAASAPMTKALGDPARFTSVPCITDNRMHRWEWVHGAEGWMKMDGVDHHAAHDLVGCQDIAWDVAGAAVELGFSAEERDAFATALAQRIGRAVPIEFVAVNELCYLAFQLGLWTMALDRNGRDERPRIQGLIDRYAQRLQSALRLGEMPR